MKMSLFLKNVNGMLILSMKCIKHKKWHGDFKYEMHKTVLHVF